MDQEDDSTAVALEIARGTVLGDRLREQWIPVLPLGLLERQHSRRVKVLGEDLVCYRDLAGTIGLIGDRCPHRYVSLEWGVAAEDGLRCPYHGWCFDETGQCIDIPIGGVDMFKDIALVGYPVMEIGGLLFAYLGEVRAPESRELSELLAASDGAEITYSVVDMPFESTFFTITDLSIPASTLSILENDAIGGEPIHVGRPRWQTSATIENCGPELRGQRQYQHGSLQDLAVSTVVVFKAPFYSVIQTGRRRIVRMRVPFDDARTVVMNHVGTVGDRIEQRTPRAFDVGALNRYGVPAGAASAVDNDEIEDDGGGGTYASAQVSTLREYMSGSGAVSRNPYQLGNLRFNNSSQDEQEHVREILEYTGFPSLYIPGKRSGSGQK